MNHHIYCLFFLTHIKLGCEFSPGENAFLDCIILSDVGACESVCIFNENMIQTISNYSYTICLESSPILVPLDITWAY